MARIDLEKHGRAIQLSLSFTNMLLLAGGLVWAAATFTSGSERDLKQANLHIAQLQAEVSDIRRSREQSLGQIREGQEKTTNRLTALETQTTFILSTLNRIEASLTRNGAPRL